jgi:levanase/fructan beta-fructosidase
MKNKMHHKILWIVLLISMFMTTSGCKKIKKQNELNTIAMFDKLKEKTLYRPNFHFTPKANWMNDPNGMFYLNGKYHLCFQYYPDGNVWGPMHWGHAISKDMIAWEEQPIAIYPDELGFIFSGSAVVDKNNTSGFGKDGIYPIVAIYTYHNLQGEKGGKIDFQTQAIAYSLDEGMSWTKYAENPVISNPGIKDFRDPKVIWDDSSSKWIMSLAAGNRIMFYSSLNLKGWKYESEFGEDKGAHGGVWECPDLFPINVDGTKETKWILLVSINPGGPNGGSATQYFVGDFDGKTFMVDENFSKQLQVQNAIWVDYGRDNYAGVTWSNIPESDGRKLFIGWMSNWDYARDVPTYTWRSSMTIARELKLKKHKEEYFLQSLPVKELYNYTDKSIVIDSLEIKEFTELINDSNINLSNLNLQFELKNLKEDTYNLMFYNKEGDTLILGLNNITNEFFINRKKAGEVGFSEKFAPNISKMKISKPLKELSVQILLDKTSVEVFYNEGKIVMTELFFTKHPLEMFLITSKDESFKIKNLNIQEFKFS